MTRVARIQPVEAHAEKSLLTAAILSTEFLQNTAQALDPRYLKSDYSRKLLGWVLEYYAEYKEAPGREIERIFEYECRNGDVPEQPAIEALLKSLSDEYGGSFNVGYATKSALEYAKKRDLYIRAQNSLALLDKGNLSDAEAEFSGYKQIAQVTSSWYNPFDSKCFGEVVSDDNMPLFQFPGALGNLVGPVNRGWFGLFLGPVKRGKTFNLAEWALHMMMQRLKVVFVSLEMSRKDMNERIYKRLVAAGNMDRRYDYPCWDCMKNQDGSCEESARTNQYSLIDEESGGHLPEYNPQDPYKPCTYCLDNMVRGERTPYEPSTWWESFNRPALSGKAWADVRDIGDMYRNNIRCISYPKFSRKFTDITRDLAMLEMNEGFIPDALILDYEGILKPENDKLTGRDAVNDTIMRMAGWAADKETLLLSASQTNRGGMKDSKGGFKESVEIDDMGEDWRKNAHVDFVLTLNQRPDERRRNLCRIGLTAHRHKDIDEQIQCLVLQQLQVGQVHLDSMLVRLYDKKYHFHSK